MIVESGSRTSYEDADLDLVKVSQGGEYVKFQLKQGLQTNVVRVGVAVSVALARMGQRLPIGIQLRAAP